MQFTSILLFAVAAIAAPLETIEARQNAVTCGSNNYSAKQVAQAVNAACTTSAGSYPHTYNNYEGFYFPSSGPYQEFPIKKSGVYTGGSPGADRVIIDSGCNYQGSITHTGASGNNFVGCSDVQ